MANTQSIRFGIGAELSTAAVRGRNFPEEPIAAIHRAKAHLSSERVLVTRNLREDDEAEVQTDEFITILSPAGPTCFTFERQEITRISKVTLGPRHAPYCGARNRNRTGCNWLAVHSLGE